MIFRMEFVESKQIEPELREDIYRVLVDGQRTPITRVYRVVRYADIGQNELRCGDDKFDMTSTNTTGHEEWIAAHLDA